MKELVIVIVFKHVLEQISQIINFALICEVPATKIRLSFDNEKQDNSASIPYSLVSSLINS